ncbi:unnamed protein product [Schistosoma rodhaini]|uniref:BAH domain-containing protein n=1 Tax=Schistosoma mansoni TaxID=6183 RepID=G4VRX2_SCHMA|nr:hypothetical protein Smp_100350 [Schistosoma mansoni]CAH8665780.1 unnamed protein product [Schistosoma rodhaini]|eukprot:XP_018654332.1 hypothetical protein Smp_100350 [Schistosoma mansoni]
MSVQTNLKDVGWMCHVIPLKKNKVQQLAPPISQIPNIGFMPEESSHEKKHTMYFKSTDSPYIRLSKMGGKPDLLCFRENEYNSGPPVPYCRCEWFYLEDNALERKQNIEPEPTKYVFKVPFYMSDSSVHQIEKSKTTEKVVDRTQPSI